MRLWLALLLAGGAVACSKSVPQVGPTSGVDPGDADSPRRLTDLTLGERRELCDWTANVGGGYGATFECEGGLVVSSFADQQACLDSFLGACSAVTVTDWEQCRDKEVTDPCALYLYPAPECATVARCLGETDGGPAPDPDGGSE